MIALCDQSSIQQITKKIRFQLQDKEAKEKGKRLYRMRTTGDKLELPWKTFRLDVAESLNAIWVSHRAKRKISGALHKETNYGKTEDGLLVVRKPVQNLSAKEVEGIRDPVIKEIIKDHIRDHGGDLKKALTSISEESPILMPSGIPIRKVRAAIPYAHITIRKGTEHEAHVQSASTHHVAIFSLGDGKYHFEPVTLYEASLRLRRKKQIIQESYQEMPPEAEYLFHLCSGDSIMAEIDGRDQLFVFKTMGAMTKQAKFILHTDARSSTERKPFTCRPNTLEKNFPESRKVNILPTGEIRSTQ